MDTDLVSKLAQALTAKHLRLATAESCTGGWIAKACTDLAGSSDWFDCSVVSYSYESKTRLLGVSAQGLQSRGAVNEQTVREMVSGLLQQSSADICVAVSGIAGPGGGSADKPVGTVWFAWQLRGAEAEAAVMHLTGDRDDVRRQAVAFALQGVIDRVADH